jgi:hypothetical protein
VIVRAMALEPKERFPSLREMGAAMLALAAERTQVVWASSFKPPVVPLPEAGALVRAPASSRPAGELAPDAQQTTPIPSLQPSRKLRWMAGGAAALLALVALWVGQRAAVPVARAVAPRPASSSEVSAGAPGVTPTGPSAPAPGVAQVQQPAVAKGERAAAEPAPSQLGAAPSELEGKTLVTRLRALQAARSPRAASARERRPKPRRPAAETSETVSAHAAANAAPADADARTAAGRSLPATPDAEETTGRRGANQSPFLD